MFEFYREHWYLIPVLLAAAIGVLILWSKALRKRAELNREHNAEVALLEEQKAALDVYRSWRNSSVAPVSDRQLFTGFALDLQSRLQYEADQAAAFAALPEKDRQVYALYFAFEDVRYEKLSQFFKEYGKPLTIEANDAMRHFADGVSADIFAKMYAAFDSDDEASSFIPAQISQWDAAFTNAMDIESVYACIGDYVRARF